MARLSQIVPCKINATKTNLPFPLFGHISIAGSKAPATEPNLQARRKFSRGN